MTDKQKPRLNPSEGTRNAISFWMAKNSVGKLREVNNDDVIVLYHFGRQQFGAKNFSGAKCIYQTLIVIDPSVFEYWLSLGLCCQRLNEDDEAVYCFGRAAAIRSDDPRPSFFVGVSYQSVGQYKQADHAYRSALKRGLGDPQFESIRTQVRDRLKHLGTRSA